MTFMLRRFRILLSGERVRRDRSFIGGVVTAPARPHHSLHLSLSVSVSVCLCFCLSACIYLSIYLSCFFISSFCVWRLSLDCLSLAVPVSLSCCMSSSHCLLSFPRTDPHPTPPTQTPMRAQRLIGFLGHWISCGLRGIWRGPTPLHGTTQFCCEAPYRAPFGPLRWSPVAQRVPSRRPINLTVRNTLLI